MFEYQPYTRVVVCLHREKEPCRSGLKCVQNLDLKKLSICAEMVYPFKVSIFGTTKELEDDLLNPDEDETIIEIIESKNKK